MRFAVLAVVLLLIVLAVLWQVLGRGPRRRRAFGRAQRLLAQGTWSEALASLNAIRAEPRLSAVWQARVRNAAGESHVLGGEQFLKEKRYEDSLQHFLTAAPLLAVDEGEQRARVIDAMLAEVRRLFAAGTGPAETEVVQALLGRVFALQSPCPEASFWLGLCLIRQGQDEPAMQALTTAHEQAGKQVIDPPLYIGILLHRLGRPQEALRVLADANRIDGGCPFVTWQMGLSLVAAGGDSGLALRALQRAMGPRGLGLWAGKPERAWVEAFPEGRSYVRRLAAKHTFVCPLLGNDLAVIVRQGQLALAQVHYRLGNFQEASDLFGKLLQECPPTITLLRGYGLSLARLGRYDQAYKHLRIALEQEEPKDPFTAGYLALCGAMGKPTQEEDKPRNVAWGMRLLARYPVIGNAEWAGLISAVHAEARALNMELGVDDQLLLCDTLASVHATDPQAAAGYAHLAATFPDALKPPHAWLYAQAATAHGVSTDRDLDLFARTFRDPQPAREYFTQQGWKFDEAEYTFLQRSSERAPGHFPEALGPDYPPRGEACLLERSRQEEAAGRKDQALRAVEVLLRLAPASLMGHDRLACLHYRRGDMDRAVALLGGWHRLAPADHWPLVRQAIIEQERGNSERRAEAIDKALGLTRGRLRAAVAFLGARLALRESAREWQAADRAPTNGEVPAGDKVPPALAKSMALLQTCLQDDPDHTEALWCLAAARSIVGDREGLAAQAPAMNRPAVPDARFHYLGAVCHLAAKDYTRALELSQRAATDPALAVESHYLMGWAHLHLDNAGAARHALQKVAAAEKNPSAVYARALLGQLGFVSGAYDEAIKWWGAVEPRRRAHWQLDETLRHTAFLSGLLNYQEGRYEQAAERFREAGKLGLRERRLGPLLTLALVKAGQRLLYEQTP
jgi:tetratricopeptide (TPR) repeat protein